MDTEIDQQDETSFSNTETNGIKCNLFMLCALKIFIFFVFVHVHGSSDILYSTKTKCSFFVFVRPACFLL